MLRSLKIALSLWASLSLLVGIASAEQRGAHKVILKVSNLNQVDSETVTLGEISSIRWATEGKALAESLAKIQIAQSPAPNSELVIKGTDLLESIKSKGINLAEVGYLIPQTIVIKRDGKALGESDIIAAVRGALESDSMYELNVKDVQWDRTIVVPSGEKLKVEVERLGEPEGGKVPIRVAVKSGKNSKRFLATALVDDWRDVPVLTRDVSRGRLISPTSIKLVRLNMKEQPADIVDDLGQLIGRRAMRVLKAGTVVRDRQVEMPPLIARGASVMLRFRQGLIDATAAGVALEDGQKGQKIAVRNVQSKRFLKAKIIDRETVEVMP